MHFFVIFDVFEEGFYTDDLFNDYYWVCHLVISGGVQRGATLIPFR